MSGLLRDVRTDLGNSTCCCIPEDSYLDAHGAENHKPHLVSTNRLQAKHTCRPTCLQLFERQVLKQDINISVVYFHSN
jgi:hypothetical protein